MDNALNFRTQKGQDDYYQAYEKTLMLWDVAYSEKYVTTSFGETYCLICGDMSNPPLVLLHAASCGATIWYPNVKALSENHAVYAIDLITEPSKSSLQKPIKGTEQCAKWLDETVDGLGISTFYMCGLSIGGWNAANYASQYPQKVKKLILLSPVQTFAKMYFFYFFKIIKMGFKPTRKSVEAYLGWGRQKEAPLPDSVIDQFTISAMNINPNGVFPKTLGMNPPRKCQAKSFFRRQTFLRIKLVSLKKFVRMKISLMKEPLFTQNVIATLHSKKVFLFQKTIHRLSQNCIKVYRIYIKA